MVSDPFDLLGLPAAFDLTSEQVERGYLRRVAALHPDLAGDGGETLAGSAELNQARDVLRDAERRAEALLRRLGGPDKSSDKALPDGFLMDILETREAIEEAVGRGAARDPAEMERWRGWARERRGEYLAAVSALFREAGGAKGDGTLRAIRRELNAWRYIERLIEQLDPEYDPAKSDGV